MWIVLIVIISSNLKSKLESPNLPCPSPLTQASIKCRIYPNVKTLRYNLIVYLSLLTLLTDTV